MIAPEVDISTLTDAGLQKYMQELVTAKGRCERWIEIIQRELQRRNRRSPTSSTGAP